MLTYFVHRQIKGEIGSFQPDGDMGDYVYQHQLGQYYNDIRELKDKIEKNTYDLENNSDYDTYARIFIGVSTLVITALITLSKFKGNIRNLKKGAVRIPMITFPPQQTQGLSGPTGPTYNPNICPY